MIPLYFKTHIFDKGFVWDEGRYDIDLLSCREQRSISKFLVPDQTYKQELISNPLAANAYLYRKLALLEPTEDGIIGFAGKYGNIKSYPIYELKDNKKIQIISHASSLRDWERAVFDLFCCSRLVKMVKDNDIGALNNIVKWYEKVVMILIPVEELPEWHIGSLNREANKFFFNTFNKPCIQFSCLSQKQAPNLFPVFKENRDVIGMAKYSIIRKAHKALMAESTVLPLVDLGSVDLKYNEYIVPKNLLAALYYQVYSDALGQKNLKQCVYCLDWFEEQRKNQMYCPEFITDYETGKLIPTGKHCKKYDFAKNKPEVIRMYNEGMSIEKIAELLRRESKQISNWVKGAGKS